MTASLKLKHHNLLFDIGRSRRYCTKRSAHFEALDKVTIFYSLVGGSAAVAAVFIGNAAAQTTGGMLVFFMTSANLVGSWGRKSVV